MKPTSTPEKIRTNSDYEPIFHYGHLRSQYTNSTIHDGSLLVEKFVRPEHLTALRRHLLQDSEILSSGNNTLLQKNLSPVSRQCLWELHSGIMLRVLENITGVHNLLPDTHCRGTRIITASSADSEANHWRDDASTGLVTALVITIQLDSGDAILFTNTPSSTKMAIKNSVLQVTYWQHRAAEYPQ